MHAFSEGRESVEGEDTSASAGDRQDPGREGGGGEGAEGASSGADEVITLELSGWVRDLNVSRLRSQLCASVNHAIFHIGMFESLVLDYGSTIPQRTGPVVTLPEHALSAEEAVESLADPAKLADCYTAVCRGLALEHPLLREHTIPLTPLSAGDRYVLADKVASTLKVAAGQGGVREVQTMCFFARDGDVRRSRLLACHTSGGVRCLPPDPPADVLCPLFTHTATYTIVGVGVMREEDGDETPHRSTRSHSAAGSSSDVRDGTGAPDPLSLPLKMSLTLIAVTSKSLITWSWNSPSFVLDRLQSLLARAIHFSSIRQYVLSSALHQKLEVGS